MVQVFYSAFYSDHKYDLFFKKKTLIICLQSTRQSLYEDSRSMRMELICQKSRKFEDIAYWPRLPFEKILHIFPALDQKLALL